MRRSLTVLSLSVAAWMLSVQPLMAQASQDYPLQDGWSGPGFYLNLLKIFGAWLLFSFWVYTTDWVSRDSQELKLNYLRWNPIIVGSFMAAFVLLWLLPIYWLGLGLLVLAYAVPLGIYVGQRNSKVHSAEKVLTPAHIRFWLASRVSSVGVKVAAEKADPHTSGPPVVLTARGGSQRDEQANLLLARQSPAFRDARQVVADALLRRADSIMLDYAPEAVNVRYMVDGVWHAGEPLDHETGDPMLESFKVLCGIRPDDPSPRKQGGFTAEFQNKKFTGTMSTQALPTGERVLLQLEGKKTPFSSLDELGMRDKMQEQLRELLSLPKGFLLFSAPPANGLRTSTNIILRIMDRFTREFAAVEEEKIRYEEVENVPVFTYSAAAKQGPEAVLPRVFLQEPNVVVVRDLVNGETVRLMCEEVARDRLLVGTIRAKDCAEALLRVLALKVPANEWSRAVSAVLNQRLVRKLCDLCKEAYAPTSDVLAQLGIPADRVQVFYRPPVGREDVCPECQGIGYIGRTAIYELLTVDRGVRDVLSKTPKLDLLRQAARKAGMRTLQEEGLALVARGTTSLDELIRVLK